MSNDSTRAPDFAGAAYGLVVGLLREMVRQDKLDEAAIERIFHLTLDIAGESNDTPTVMLLTEDADHLIRSARSRAGEEPDNDNEGSED